MLAVSAAACGFDPHGTQAVDECALGIDECAPSAICTDTPSSYTCACPPNQIGDGRTCDIPFVAVGTGLDTSYGIGGDGALWAWGGNEYSELGDGTQVHSAIPKPIVAPANGWITVSGGAHRACGMRTGNELWCWGFGGYGFGDNTTDAAPTPRQVLGAWRSVSVGFLHTCAIDIAGTLFCWGLGDNGQLGNGGLLQHSGPTMVPGGPWSAVSAGGYQTCAIATAGGMSCWGYNGNGQLGVGTNTVTYLAPTAVQTIPANARWLSVSAGRFHTCGTRSDGLWCWGAGESGELGDGRTLTSNTPVRVSSEAWTSVDAGSGGTCGLLRDDLWCWGSDEFGAVGDGEPIDRNAATPKAVAAGATKWKALSSGSGFHRCAVSDDGVARCWGANGSDQVGGVASELATFTEMVGVSHRSISVGALATCGIGDDNHVGCWGWGATGMRGDGTSATNARPSTIIGVWRQVAAGLYHVCALSTNGAVACWGANSSYELGRVAAGTATPMDVSGSYLMLSTGLSTSCAESSGHNIYCWGDNSTGQLGDGTTIARALGAATQYDTRSWRDLSVGAFHTCSIDFDGKLTCWGRNDYGQLGRGDVSGLQLTPYLVPSIGRWIAVSVGYLATCAIAESATIGGGTLWCWGDNSSGQLGLGTMSPTPMVIPMPVGSDETWADVATGLTHTCAVRLDGTLWCWGTSTWGATGVGPAVAVPARVGDATDWRSVSTKLDTTCATRANDTTWCTGRNQWSQAGQAAVVPAPMAVNRPR
jgi:alpha-tubulin suppressor-like RCC1 family protein